MDKSSDAVENSYPFPAANGINTDWQNRPVTVGSHSLSGRRLPSLSSEAPLENRSGAGLSLPQRQDLGRGKAGHHTQSCCALPGYTATPRNSHIFDFVRHKLQVRF